MPVAKNFFNLVFCGNTDTDASTRNVPRSRAVEYSFLTRNVNRKKLNSIIDRTGIAHRDRFYRSNQLADIQFSASGWIPDFDEIVNPGNIQQVLLFGEYESQLFSGPAFDHDPFDPNNFDPEGFLPFNFEAKFDNEVKYRTILKDYHFDHIEPTNNNTDYRPMSTPLDFGANAARKLQFITSMSDVRSVNVSRVVFRFEKSSDGNTWTLLSFADNRLFFPEILAAGQGKAAYAYLNQPVMPAAETFRFLRVMIHVVANGVNNEYAGVLNSAARIIP